MDEQEFFSRVCQGMGWEPTPTRIAMFKAWAYEEGMPFERTWNPLATTWYFNGPPLDETYNNGYGAGNWNWVPVRVYRDAEAGIEATVLTLSQTAYYRWIRKSFEDETGYDEAVADLATWSGGGGYIYRVINAWKELGGDMADPRVDEILVTLQATGIQAWKDSDNESLKDTITKIQNDIASIKQTLDTMATAGSLQPYGCPQAYALNDVLTNFWKPALQSLVPGLVLP